MYILPYLVLSFYQLEFLWILNIYNVIFLIFKVCRTTKFNKTHMHLLLMYEINLIFREET